jgi:hypothetical protein
MAPSGWGCVAYEDVDVRYDAVLCGFRGWSLGYSTNNETQISESLKHKFQQNDGGYTKIPFTALRKLDVVMNQCG